MMKRLALLLATLPMAAHAGGAGTLEIAGDTNLGFQSSSSKLGGGGVTGTTDETAYGIGTTMLYYVTPNVAVGATLGYRSVTDEFKPGASVTSGNGTTSFEDGKTTQTRLLIGPAAAYELEVAPKIAVFGLGSFGYARETLAATGLSEETSSGFGLGLEVGAKYFVARSFSLDASVGYDYVRLSGAKIAGVSSTTTDSGFGLNLGLSVYFGGAEH